MARLTFIRWYGFRRAKSLAGAFDSDHGLTAEYGSIRKWLRSQGVHVRRSPTIERRQMNGQTWLGYDYNAELTDAEAVAFKLRFGSVPWRSVREVA